MRALPRDSVARRRRRSGYAVDGARAAPAAQPTSAASASTVGPPLAPAPGPGPPPARQGPRPIPFRLSLTYSRVLGEDGDLTNDQLSTNAIGINFDFPSTTYVRNHFGIANQWESQSAGGYSARGFRIDLISFGYPITLVDSRVRLDLEPIVTLVRGEIMFVSGGPTFFRMESGFGLDLSATYRQWFLSLEPDVDFRYWTYAKNDSQTGFGRVFPLRFAFGHEF